MSRNHAICDSSKPASTGATRRWFVVGGLALAAYGLVGCKPIMPPAAGVPVGGLRLLDLAGGSGDVQLGYMLDRPMRATVTIFDAMLQPIRTIETQPRAAGPQWVLWDGRDDRGRLVYDEVYPWSVAAGSASEFTALALDSGGRPLSLESRSFERSTREFRYDLPEGARVRLRLGLRGGALLRTLLDWTPQQEGAQVVAWDGRDVDGLFEAADHPDLAYDLAAFSLPSPAVLVVGNPAPPGRSPFPHRPEYAGGPAQPAGGDLSLHAQHPRTACREPQVFVDFPETARQAAGGIPVVRGVTTVQVGVAAQDTALVSGDPFEVYLFVDAVLLTEVVADQLPFRYEWNTAGLNEGPHVLTVNLKTADDHIGVRSVAVVVEA